MAEPSVGTQQRAPPVPRTFRLRLQLRHDDSVGSVAAAAAALTNDSGTASSRGTPSLQLPGRQEGSHK